MCHTEFDTSLQKGARRKLLPDTRVRLFPPLTTYSQHAPTAGYNDSNSLSVYSVRSLLVLCSYYLPQPSLLTIPTMHLFSLEFSTPRLIFGASGQSPILRSSAEPPDFPPSFPHHTPIKAVPSQQPIFLTFHPLQIRAVHQFLAPTFLAALHT